MRRFRICWRSALDALPHLVPHIRVNFSHSNSFSPDQPNATQRFIVGLAITFRMQSSYSRWWEGRIQWDKLSADSRSFARTIWLHVPLPKAEPTENGGDIPDKIEVIRCVHALAVSLKHHLRGERDWSECTDLEQLLAHLSNVSRSA
jgi:putative membrane protein